MKQAAIWILLTVLLAFGPLEALAVAQDGEAGAAPDLTSSCAFTSSGGGTLAKLHDGLYTTHWTSKERAAPWLECVLPEGERAGFLYVCFAEMPDAWRVEAPSGDGWRTLVQGDTAYLHAFVPLGGAERFRLTAEFARADSLVINELYVFGEGTSPDWVQRWEPAPDKADLLVLAAHPDDELIFFGGLIPTYAVERGKQTVVAYMTGSNTTRVSELLNGLWSMGVRAYPVVGPFYDGYSSSLEEGYQKWPKQRARAFVMELIRRYRPDVLVTHDINGEYGHGAHRVCADVALFCAQNSRDASVCPESAEAYGVWELKKLYLHLYGESPLALDWNVPLASQNGRTGLEAARDAYAFHVTQQTTRFAVEAGGPYDCAAFGLAYTSVGADEAGDDLFEHVLPGGSGEAVLMSEREDGPEAAPAEEGALEPEAAPKPGEAGLTAPAEEPMPGPESLPEATPALGQRGALDSGPAPESAPATADAPELIPSPAPPSYARPAVTCDWPAEAICERDALGYPTQGEHVVEDDEGGLWFYASPSLVVRIDRYVDESAPLTWYEAEIFADTAQNRFASVLYDPEKPQAKHVQPAQIATQNQVVFGMNTDYYTYRVGRGLKVGVIVRGGRLLYDDAPRALRSKFPNLDTLALFPDGTWLVSDFDAYSGEDFLRMGAMDVFSFGPWLIRDGEVSEYVKTSARGRYAEPRCAVGYFENGHYFALMAEGRMGRTSAGVSLSGLAELMRASGVRFAFNLDGGQTAAFTFMGRRITRVGTYSGGRTYPRATTEVLGIGVSGLIDSEGETE